MDDSEQVLDLFPNHRGFSYRGDFGGQPLKCPFRASLRSCSELLPGYLWLPHLYQDKLSLEEQSAKSE